MKIINLLKNLQLNTEYSGEDVIADMYYQYKIFDLEKPIVISFPAVGGKEIYDPKTPIPGFKFLSKYNVNVISFGIIGSMNDNYFITPEFSKFIEDLGEQLNQFKLRLGYSNSKGGFGIGTYAEALKLDSALLFFPVSTKKIELAPWDTRKSTQDAKHLSWSSPYNKVNLGSCNGYIIYDPVDEIDTNHANNFEGLKHIKINGLVHGDGYHFLVKNTDLIKNIVNDFFEKQELDIKEIRAKTKYLRLSRRYYERLLNKKPKNKTLLTNQKKLISILDSPLNKKKNATHNGTEISNEEIDLLRDSAINLESINLEKSLSLMELAHKLRPTGPFIMKKISDYKKILNK